MKRNAVLGAWYALVLCGFLAADQFRVTVKSAGIFPNADDWTPATDWVEFGKVIEPTGPMSDVYHPVTINGKPGWINEKDLLEAKKFEAGAAGGKSMDSSDGAYVKGFDPEVEKKSRADDATLDRIYREQVLPLIWKTRGSKELEEAEEHLEELQLQAKGDSDEAKATRAEIERLTRLVEPIRDRWQDELKKFRDQGKIGEFAGARK